MPPARWHAIQPRFGKIGTIWFANETFSGSGGSGSTVTRARASVTVLAAIGTRGMSTVASGAAPSSNVPGGTSTNIDQPELELIRALRSGSRFWLKKNGPATGLAV